MPDRACIFYDRSDNCFVIVNKVGLWYIGTGQLISIPNYYSTEETLFLFDEV